MHKRPITEKIYSELCEVIPGGVNSPVRSCAKMQQLPMVAEKAFADQIIDADGNAYTDFCGSWGALIHGHAHPDILRAVKERMDKGTSFGVTTAIERDIAQEIIGLIDSVEKIRFVSSGTEATMSAVRLARGYTNRDLIVKFNGNYHGHVDFFLVSAGSGVIDASPSASSGGVPNEIVKQTISIPYNDIEACRQVIEHPDYRHRIAGVILEPVAGNIGVVPASPEFINYLRKATQKIGALLIFDEVMTGFRVGLKGAQGYYAVRPDLTCFGKIIGGGFPAAAFGGRREIMDHLAPLGSVYQAGTLSGNPVAMEAGLQSLRLLQSHGFYEELERKTDLLVKPIKEEIDRNGWNVCLQRVGSMFTLFFGKKSVNNFEEALELDSDQFVRFFQYMFNHGIYVPPSPHEAWFMSMAHRDDNIIKAREAVLCFLKENCS